MTRGNEGNLRHSTMEGIHYTMKHFSIPTHHTFLPIAADLAASHHVLSGDVDLDVGVDAKTIADRLDSAESLHVEETRQAGH